MKHVAGKTSGVHANQNALVILAGLAVYERDVFVRIDIVLVADDFPDTEFSWQSGLSNTMHETLGLETIRHELRDRDEGQVVLCCEFLELRAP